MDVPNQENTPQEENQPNPQPKEPSAAQSFEPQSETATADEAISPDSRTLAMVSHLLGIFTSFVGPLILWLIKKDESKFVEDQSREALNFQLTMLIGQLIGVATSPFCIGFIIMPAVGLVTLIFGIIACVEANKGVRYRYPICLRMVTQ